MTEELALTLLEELVKSQQTLADELHDLTLQVELSETLEFNSIAAHQSH